MTLKLFVISYGWLWKPLILTLGLLVESLRALACNSEWESEVGVLILHGTYLLIC